MIVFLLDKRRKLCYHKGLKLNYYSMKKILLLVVLAAAVGTTIKAQDRVQKFFNGMNYEFHRQENIERRWEGISSRYGRSHKAPAPKDRNVETRYVKGLGQVSYVYCDNIMFIVTPTDVEVLVPKEGKMEHLRYVTRNDYGTHFIARGVRFNGYINLRAVVDNNNVKTVLRLYDGGTIIKSFWFDQPHKRLTPQYPRNKRKNW